VVEMQLNSSEFSIKTIKQMQTKERNAKVFLGFISKTFKKKFMAFSYFSFVKNKMPKVLIENVL